MKHEARPALAGCSTATVTMQLLKRGLRATAMRGVKPLAPEQGAGPSAARPGGGIT